MPTSVPNFNFLARLFSEIWGGPKIKSGSSWFLQTPPSGQIFIQGASMRKCTSVPNFNFLALLISEIKRVSQNLMWGYQPPAVPHTLKLLCLLKVLGKVKQRAKFQHRISMDHAVMRICISHRFSIIWAQKWGFWGFWGWRCENVIL